MVDKIKNNTELLNLDDDKSYDFYQKMIINHLSNTNIAYERFCSEGKSEKYDYKTIHDWVELQSTIWFELGLGRGSKITLVNVTGIDLIVYMMTALNLGCIFSVLNVSLNNRFDDFLFKSRLEKIVPDLIVISSVICCEDVWELLSPYKEKVYLTKSLHSTNKTTQGSDIDTLYESNLRQYQPDQIVCINFDYGAEDSCKPFSLSAQHLYLSLQLNMSTQVMNLQSKDILIFPYVSNKVYQQGSILTSLYAGIHYIDAQKYFIQLFKRGNKFFVSNKENFVVGLTHELRDELIIADEAMNTWRHCFVIKSHKEIDNEGTKKLGAEHNQSQWELFKDKCFKNFDERMLFHWQSVLCGFSLIEHKAHIKAEEKIIPICERKFTLVDPVIGQESLAGVGLYSCQINAEDNFVSRHQLMRLDNGKKYVRCSQKEVIRNEKLYPKADLIRYLNSVASQKDKYWVGCYFLPDSMTKVDHITLLIFYCAIAHQQDDIEKQQKNLVNKLQGKIKDALGDNFLPDETICYFYKPRGMGDVKNKGINSQYMTGKLSNKSGDTLFRLLSLYRHFISV